MLTNGIRGSGSSSNVRKTMQSVKGLQDSPSSNVRDDAPSRPVTNCHKLGKHLRDDHELHETLP